METVSLFLKNEKRKNDENIIKVKNKISEYYYKIDEIDRLIEEINKNIDKTYEIFTPNGYDKNINEVEIEKLQVKKIDFENKISDLNNRMHFYNERSVKIDEAISDAKKMEEQIIDSFKGAKSKVETEVKKTKKESASEFMKMLDLQMEKDNNIVKEKLKKDIDDISSKLILCDNFVNVDANRTKIELYKIKEVVDSIKKTISSKMFHVKHTETNPEFIENVSLLETLKEFLNTYDNIKTDFNYSGPNVDDTINRVTNVIRIIEESINNAINHGCSGVISLNVVVENIGSVRSLDTQGFLDMSDEDSADNNLKLSDNSNNDSDNSNNSDNTDVSLNISAGNTDNKTDELSELDSLFAGLEKPKEKIKTKTKSSKTKEKNMHQINFIIKEENRYRINIKISDNGEGFKVEDNKKYADRGMYGISLMKYRTDLLNGTFNIESKLGLGTTVTLVYDC